MHRDFKKGVDTQKQRRIREEVNVVLRKKDREAQVNKRRQRGSQQAQQAALQAQQAQAQQAQMNMGQGQAQMGQPQMNMGQGQAQMGQGQAQMGQGQVQNMGQGQANVDMAQRGILQAQMQQQAIAAAAGKDKLTPEQVTELLANLPTLLAKCVGQNVDYNLEGVMSIRQLLSIEKSPPIQEIIEKGFVPILVRFLRAVQVPPEFRQKQLRLQFEAGWALTNIASGTTEQAQCVVRHGALPLFVLLLRSPDADVREQSVWALGNIAGDSTKFRDLCLNHGILRFLLPLFYQSPALTMLRNATWTLSNLCRGKPKPNFEMVKHMLPVLRQLVSHTDKEVLTDAFWALSYLSDGDNDRIQGVIDTDNICQILVDRLSHEAPTVQIPVLRTVGNIVTGDDQQTERMLSYKPLPKLAVLLAHSRKTVRKEACWTISNITAGTPSQVQQVMDSNLMQAVISLCEHDRYDVRKEACWAISNITSGGTVDQIRQIIEFGALESLCSMTNGPDSKMVLVSLEAIGNILKLGESTSGINPYCVRAEQSGGLAKIDALKEHLNEEVYELAVSLLQTYFEEVDENEESPDMAVNANMYSFGGGAAPPGGGFNFPSI